MKTDKEKLFESFEKVCGIKFLNESDNKEILEENWKNWAIGLGIVASSFFTQPTNAEDLLKVKEKVENVVNKDITLKKLQKEGFSPAIGDRINPNKSLFDSGIEVIGNTETAVKFQLIEILKSKGINHSNIMKPEGIIVYKKEGKNIRAKWIGYK
jgi:hypothetical protein